MKTLLLLVMLPFLSGCIHQSTSPQAKRGAISSASLAAARKYIGSDPNAEFRKNKEAHAVSFYSYGSLLSGDHFPGLSQKEVDEWISRAHYPVVRKFQDDPAPYFVGVDFTVADYWDAVDEFLTAYNRLVLAEVTRQPNNAPEPTTTAVTPRADARVAPAAVVAHL